MLALKPVLRGQVAAVAQDGVAAFPSSVMLTVTVSPVPVAVGVPEKIAA
jgi:hypothetical protein